MLKNIILLSILIGIEAVGYSLDDTNQNEKLTNYVMPEVVITASKYVQPEKEVASAVTIISAEDIEKKKGSDVKDLLRDVPGVEVSQAGDFGGIANVYLRGTMPGSTLVMIDGVPANSPGSVDNSFNFAFLNTDNIDRIEIIRGPQSALYGSGAIGGVINIITKKGKGVPQSFGEMSAGSYNTYKIAAGTRGEISNWNYALTLSHETSDGISKAALSNTIADPEKDGFEATSFSANVGFIPFDGASLDYVLSYNYGKTDMDGGAYIDELNSWFDNEDLSMLLTFRQKAVEWWNYQIAVSYFNNKYDYNNTMIQASAVMDTNSNITVSATDTFMNYWYKGYSFKGSFQNSLTVFNINNLTSGIDCELDDAYNTETNLEIFRTNASIYAEDSIKLLDILIPSIGGRLDYSPDYGIVTTFKLSSICMFSNIGLSLKANYGSGFKAPSLYQLYSPYGNTNLKPQQSTGFDVGFTEYLWDDKVVLDAAYFKNDSSNRIDYDYSIYQYINITNSRSWGVEASLVLRPLEFLSLKVDYTYTYSIDLDSGLQLLKIPQHKGGIEAGVTPFKGLDLIVDVNYTGRRFDYPRVELPDYVKTDVFVNYRNKNVVVFGSIDNLFNVVYQDTYGYLTPGINFKAGIRYEL